ncbi:PilZ domain-containing protein [Vibrio sp. NTOU-M3]|uniref:PilZ domain-containing protein n=1 Tax=Vibrio sp. NTOU-M3 TaxID=3234954 RepID=UPI00349F6030
MKLSASLEFGLDERFDFTTQFVGAKPSQFLILDLPQKAQETLILKKIAHRAIIIRALTKTRLGDIIAFKTTVISQTTRPSGLLFVKLPHYYSKKPIRSDERFQVNLPAMVQSETLTCKAKIKDISVSGLALVIKSEQALEKGQLIEIDSELNDHLPESLTFEIVSTQKLRHGYKYGVRYSERIKVSEELRISLLENSYRQISQ